MKDLIFKAIFFATLGVVLLGVPASAASLVLDGTSATLDGTKNYDSVTLRNGAVLYITPYDGTATTGRLVLNVVGDVNIDSTSKIIGDERGYRGGAGGTKGICSTSGCTQTSSYCGWYGCSYWYDCPPVSGGGSGGEMGGSAGGSGKTVYICAGCGNQECSSWGNSYYSYPGSGGGGGGGGYGTAGGGIGGGAEMGTLSGYDISMGAGGGGGGGGGSTGNTDNTDGGKGGNGGASLTINAKNIILRGTVSMNGGGGGNGGNGATPNTWYSSGCWGPWCWRNGPYYTVTNGGIGGGGGAGGGILLNASGNIDVSSATISAVGGSGGAGGTNSNGGAAAGGSSGGGGRIKIFYGGLYTNSGAAISAGSVYFKNVDEIPPTVDISKSPSVYNQITLSSTAVDGGGIKLHKIRYWVNDVPNEKDCGASVSCTATIGPYAGGTAIKYQSEATDYGNNIGSTTVYSFTVEKTNNVHIGGRVWYNNQTANAQIQSVFVNVTVNRTYSNWGYPNPQGVFYITIEHVPTSLTRFMVEIKAMGEVVSAFGCNYDFEKKTCSNL